MMMMMMMMMMVENLPIFAEKRQYISGLAAELRGAKDWMKVATAGDEGIRLYTWQHQDQRPGERKLTAGKFKSSSHLEQVKKDVRRPAKDKH